MHVSVDAVEQHRSTCSKTDAEQLAFQVLLAVPIFCAAPVYAYETTVLLVEYCVVVSVPVLMTSVIVLSHSSVATSQHRLWMARQTCLD